jgi:4-hydroxy-tetrahydrodipicolinate reductase
MTVPLKIAISGAAGRMGIALIRALSTHPSLELTAAGIRTGAAGLTRNAFENAGISFAAELMVESTAELFTKADAVIDFTAPEYTVGLAGLAALHKKALISGTTGLNATQKEALIRAGESTRVVWSANMSVGVNLLMALVGEAAARGRGVDLHDVWVKSRDGHTGARHPGTIGFATLRGGDVIGDHSVIFAGQGERLELSHKASNRDIFARGALVAAQWSAGKGPGFYTMRDVVGL